MKIVKPEDKRILNGPECFNLEPFKYPWAFDYFENMQSNHWTPSAIPMGKDLDDFKFRLNSPWQHIVENVLSTLTTMDHLASLNFSTFVSDNAPIKMTCPEINNTVVWQAGQETIHSWSYKILLDTLQFDTEDIYNRYVRIPQIKNKIEFSRDVMNLNTYNLDDFLFKYIFFAVIFEGVWFYGGFNPILSLGARSPALMRGTIEQLVYIMRDEEIHSNFGIEVIKAINKELGRDAFDSGFTARLQKMFKECLDLEEEYIKYIIAEPVFGYTADDHLAHTRYLINKRCYKLGVVSSIVNSTPQFPWLDAVSGAILKESNFFETRVKEYRVGQKLSWD